MRIALLVGYRSGPYTGHHRHKIGYQQRKTYRKTATQPLPTPGDYNEKEKNKIYRINARIKVLQAHVYLYMRLCAYVYMSVYGHVHLCVCHTFRVAEEQG